MYTRLHYGSDIGGILKYARKDDAEDIGGDLAVVPEDERAAEFERRAQANPLVRRPVGHLVIGWTPDDQPTNREMVEVADRLLGTITPQAEDVQSLLIRHHDTDQPHCHLLFNRVLPDGSLVEDKGFPGRRIRAEAHELEREYSWTQAVDDKALPTPDRERRHQAAADGRFDHRRHKYIAHDAVTRAVSASDGTFESVDALMRREGTITPTWSFTSTGDFNGASFAITEPGSADPLLTPDGDPVAYKGSQLGPKPGLSKAVLLEMMAAQRARLAGEHDRMTLAQIRQATRELRAARMTNRRRAYRLGGFGRPPFSLRLFDRRMASRHLPSFIRQPRRRR
ncbi:MAG: relaxase/mobilization nuclease domain-containing protein [Planctomycetota bacterium]|jgi:hypothetical protein|nr:relaxase/mobilization nuclease domain-containing protein [Planctomycetota bacterium]